MSNKKKEELTEILQFRDYKVVKSNELIQKARFNLSMQEQKIILYLISKIMPEDIELKEHTFEVIDFCKVCGLYQDSGKNYQNIKSTVKALADKSVWIELDNKTETLVRWINKAWINKKSGSIKIRLDNDLSPYLLQLQERFTQYELLYTLAMKSQYSIRLYELLKSYEYRHNHIFDIEELKKTLYADTYHRFPDFRRYVLETAIREINEFSDLIVAYEIEKEGRRFAKIVFKIKLKKGFDEKLETWTKIEKAISPNPTRTKSNKVKSLSNGELEIGQLEI